MSRFHTNCAHICLVRFFYYTYIFRHYSFCKVYHHDSVVPNNRLDRLFSHVFLANINWTIWDQHQWDLVTGIYRWQVDSFHKWPVMQKAPPYRDHIWHVDDISRYLRKRPRTRMLSILRVKYYIKAQLFGHMLCINVPGSHISFQHMVLGAW